MPPDFTFAQLQMDLDILEQAERAFEAEAERQYDFDPVAPKVVMPRILSGNVSEARASDRLIACDPTGLNTLTIPLRAGQGRLQRGTFSTWDGYRSLAPSQINGVLSLDIDIDSDSCPDGCAVAVLRKRPIRVVPNLYCES